MDQKEKSCKSRAGILALAFREFAEKGYDRASLNALCAANGLPKGLLYYYFKDKDALYLACLEECFSCIAAYLQQHLPPPPLQPEAYFDLRLQFFRAHPYHQQLFCQAVVHPPRHLAARIRQCKKPLDEWNGQVLAAILSGRPLAAGHTLDSAVRQLRLFEDYLNASFALAGSGFPTAEEQDRLCREALRTMLYGLIARG